MLNSRNFGIADTIHQGVCNNHVRHEYVQGFYEVIPHNLVCVFNYQELELLLCGLPRIDVKDWQANTRYGGAYNKDHQVVRWFFEVLGTWEGEHKARLLQFATGSSHVPVEGFRALQVCVSVCCAQRGVKQKRSFAN